MNLAKCSYSRPFSAGPGKCCLLFLFAIFTVGCSSPKLVTDEKYLEFLKAGPVVPQVDQNKLVAAKVPSDIYRVVIDDVIDLTVPIVMVSVDPVSLDDSITYECRVAKDGTVSLPVAGAIKVVGKDLAEVEEAVIAAFYPKYINERLPVSAKMAEYHTQSVSIIGAINTPGLYQLRSDEMSLVTLLMKSGGIVSSGAGVIRVKRVGYSKLSEKIVLPVKGLNISFKDIQLVRGDVVEVERLKPEVFTVIGLVNNRGAFPYPPEAKYNVLQSLAFAGGVNEIADPQYIKIYRQDSEGKIVDATFKIDGEGIANAVQVRIKPGDVVSVEQTDRTRTRLVLSQIIKFQTGVQMVYRLDQDDINADN